MNVRVIPRTTVDGALKLVRLPLNGAIGLLPGNASGPGPAAGRALDRVDASVRAMLGGLLGDPVLREDARRRRVAADEREHAQELRGVADRTSQQADARLQERHDQAGRRREQADREAQTKRREAARRREQKTDRAAQAERARLAASRQTAQRAADAIDEQAPKARLASLQAKSDALREREKALAARDEARRLREAAGRAKAARKRNNKPS